MNFGQIVDQVLAFRNQTRATENPRTLAWIERAINETQDEILTLIEPEWSQAIHKFRTEEPITTGTVSVTEGRSLVSEAVAGANGWGDGRTLIGRKITFGTRQEWYDIVGFVDGNPDQIRIDPPFAGPTSTATYAAYQDLYPLPMDFRQAISCRLETQSRGLRYIEASELDHGTWRLFERSPGLPEFYSISNRRRVALIEEPSSGASLTNGSPTVTFANFTAGFTVDDPRVRGATLTFSGTSLSLSVRLASSTNAVMLYEPWRGPTVSFTGWTIAPKEQALLQLWPVPNTEEVVELRYYHRGSMMVNPEDQPSLPEEYHDALWKGAVYRAKLLSALPDQIPQLGALRNQFEEAVNRAVLGLSHDADRTEHRRTFRHGGSYSIPYGVYTLDRARWG